MEMEHISNDGGMLNSRSRDGSDQDYIYEKPSARYWQTHFSLHDPASRRNLIIIVLAILVCVALVVGIVAAVRSCSQVYRGSVTDSAEEVASSFMVTAFGIASDVHSRAAAGLGVVDGVVCIDAGHGGGVDLTLTPIGPGSDEMQYVEPGGTAGIISRTPESDVTLAVALLLRDKLEDAGVTVVMVREDDESPISSQHRAEIANESGADIFIRLHCDGSEDPNVTGFSTLVPGENEWTADIVESSAYAAEIMHPIIVEAIGARDDGIIQRTDLAGFNYCEIPSVLFEMGFMTNPDEDLLLNDPEYQELLAQAICDATIAYLEAISD